MKTGLLIFSAILIIVGIASDFFPLIIVGLFLLVPAVMAGRRPRMEERSSSRPGTIAPESKKPQQLAASPVPEMSNQSPLPSEAKIDPPLFPTLFPSQMFPTLSPMQLEPQTQVETHRDSETPQELAELAVIFLFATLLSKRQR